MRKGYGSRFQSSDVCSVDKSTLRQMHVTDHLENNRNLYKRFRSINELQ